MTGGGEDFARETGTAADVEDEASAGGGEMEEGERAVGHLGLDGGDAGGGGVFLGDRVVVVEICGAGGKGRQGELWVL